MIRALFTSYVTGITDQSTGQSYNRIMRYFIPEFITALLLYSMPFWIDAYFVSLLESTTTYATLGATNNLLHLLIKIAEAFSVGTLVLSGQLNGMQEYKKVGHALRDAFWITCLAGTTLAAFLFFGAYWIYWWYGVPAEMIPLGIPFLRIRALGVLFSFICMACIGFLRGIKNVKTPMKIFIAGAAVFIAFDYALIFGKFGLPAYGLFGSGIASVIQYGCMMLLALGTVLFRKKYYKYGIALISDIGGPYYFLSLIKLSWPVVLDKATMAMAYIWLCKMICPLGTCAVATFCVVKDMERFAFLPAMAFANVITLLVSNDFGIENFTGIKTNIKRVVFLAGIFVCILLTLFSFKAEAIAQVFDKKGDFSGLAARVFPLLSVLVLFDLLQLVLAGALRGAGNVKTVMMTRLIVCLGYFVPVSYFVSQLPIADTTLKFTLIYGSFYVGSALMSLMYIRRFRGNKWKRPTL